jgi:hypothetical protein
VGYPYILQRGTTNIFKILQTIFVFKTSNLVTIFLSFQIFLEYLNYSLSPFSNSENWLQIEKGSVFFKRSSRPLLLSGPDRPPWPFLLSGPSWPSQPTGAQSPPVPLHAVCSLLPPVSSLLSPYRDGEEGSVRRVTATGLAPPLNRSTRPQPCKP